MEVSINMNDDHHHHPINPLPVSITLQRHRPITSSSSSSIASSFLNLIYRRKKTIFILLCCSSLLMNQIFSLIPTLHPSSSFDQSSQNPLSNPDFNYTHILKSPFSSPIPPIPSPAKTITQDLQILQFSLDSTVDSLKKSNTHILNLLNNQDLSGEQKNVLMICQDRNERIAEKLQMANRELNKAIDDLDFFLDHETACRRLRQIDMFLTMSVVDQDLCEQNLLKSFLLDLKIPTSSVLSSSLELAKGIEKDCRKGIEEEKKGEMATTTTNVSPRHDGSVFGKKMKTYPWKKSETMSNIAMEEEEEEAMDSDFDIDDESFYRRY